jgi:hypothetical protein
VLCDDDTGDELQDLGGPQVVSISFEVTVPWLAASEVPTALS